MILMYKAKQMFLKCFYDNTIKIFSLQPTKLKEVHFSFGAVIVHFKDKYYQEINCKSRLNIVPLFKLGKNTIRFAHVPFNFISLYLFVLIFAIILKDYKIHL